MAPSTDGKSSPSRTIHEVHDPSSPRYVDPSMWCITREDLEVFEREVRGLWNAGGIPDDPNFPNAHHDDPKIGPSVHQVTEHYIKPKTQASGGISWALMRNGPHGIRCEAFAIHTWAEGVFDFIEKVRRVWPHDANTLYVSFLSNPQISNMAEPLNGNLKESPFVKALNTARYVFVIPDNFTSIYQRLWCVYEAHLAVQAVRDQDLMICFPWVVDPKWVAAQTIPGLILPFVLGVLCDILLAPAIVSLFGPVMWITVTYIVCSVGAEIVRRMSYFKRVFCYIDLFFVGIGTGLALGSLRGLDQKASTLLALSVGRPTMTNFEISWEPGEETACTLIIVSIVLVVVHNISAVLIQDILEAQGAELEFETVREGKCSQEEDEFHIKNAISGQEEEMDKSIKMLKTIGRYDRAVHDNLALGMSHERARDGVSPFKVVAVWLCWQYWWITDKVGRNQQYLALGTLVVCVTLSLLLVYHIGDRTIHAVDMGLVFGVGFILVSSSSSSFFTRDAVISLNMSQRTIWLQIVFFTLMLFADVLFYGGYLKIMQRWCNNTCSTNGEADAESDYIGAAGDGSELTPLMGERTQKSSASLSPGGAQTSMPSTGPPVPKKTTTGDRDDDCDADSESETATLLPKKSTQPSSKERQQSFQGNKGSQPSSSFGSFGSNQRAPAEDEEANVLPESMWSLTLLAAVGQVKWSGGSLVSMWLIVFICVVMGIAQILAIFLIIHDLNPEASPITTPETTPYEWVERTWTVNSLKWIMITFLSMSLTSEARQCESTLRSSILLSHGRLNTLPIMMCLSQYVILCAVVFGGVSVILSCQGVPDILFNSMAITFVVRVDDLCCVFISKSLALQLDFEYKDAEDHDRDHVSPLVKKILKAMVPAPLGLAYVIAAIAFCSDSMPER